MCFHTRIVLQSSLVANLTIHKNNAQFVRYFYVFFIYFLLPTTKNRTEHNKGHELIPSRSKEHRKHQLF